MISISIYLKIYEIKQSEPTERLSKCQLQSETKFAGTFLIYSEEETTTTTTTKTMTTVTYQVVKTSTEQIQYINMN